MLNKVRVVLLVRNDLVEQREVIEHSIAIFRNSQDPVRLPDDSGKEGYSLVRCTILKTDLDWLNAQSDELPADITEFPVENA